MESREGSDWEAQAVFRFVGDEVDPDEVTSRVGIQPSMAHAKGDAVPGRVGRRQYTGLWRVESPLPRDRPLEEHLLWLLDVIEPSAAAIRELIAAGLHADFFCGFTTAAPDYTSHIRLEAGTLRRMSDLGAALDVQLYCLDDDDPSTPGPLEPAAMS